MTKPSDHCQRLMQSMSELVALQGYTATTVADIVKHAKVSRRTFYEHFSDKQACLLYCYEQSSQQTLTQIYQAISEMRHPSPVSSWQQQLSTGIGVFLQCMQAQPMYMRVLYMEIVAAGAEGLRVRRQVLQQFALIFSQVLELIAPNQMPSSHDAMAMAIVGAIHELLLQAFEDNQTDEMMALAPVLERLVIGVLNSLTTSQSVVEQKQEITMAIYG